MKDSGEPFRATDKLTTPRFQLSISVLISFQLSPGATLLRLVLVARHAVAHSRSRETKKLDAPDAAPPLLLDCAADGQSQVLGRFSVARSDGGGGVVDLACALVSHALSDR